MEFEIDAWGIFFIDDYYRDGLMLFLDNPEFAEEFKRKFFDMSKKLYTDKVNHIDVLKISFRYKETIQFLKEINGGYLLGSEKAFDSKKYIELGEFFLAQHAFLNTQENAYYLLINNDDEKSALVRFKEHVDTVYENGSDNEFQNIYEAIKEAVNCYLEKAAKISNINL